MHFFNSTEQSLIRRIAETKNIRTRICLLTTGHPRDEAFRTLTDELARLVPGLEADCREKDGGLPGLVLRDNLVFCALPLEKELEPFLLALSQLSSETFALSPKIQKDIGRIREPVRLTLYIASQCPFCPVMVQTLVPLALGCPHIRLHIIDGSLFPESAAADKVMSAPCLLLEDEFRWTGQADAEEILSMIISRDLSRLSPETLKSILEQGEAAWITRAMIRRDTLFDGFIALLLHETWSVRLGALVVVEGLADQAPDLAGRLCATLINRFRDTGTTVQGDILYALGIAGNADTLAWIRSLRPELSLEELMDAADDAIVELTQKQV